MSTLPQTAEEVVSALSAAFGDMPPALQAAARYIVDNPREVGVKSMRALAGEASVHPNAFIRLARQIGFDGYEEMRERFRDFLVSDGLGNFGDRAHWLQELEAKGGTAEILGRMMAALTDNLERGLLNQDVEKLNRIADRLIQAKTVYVVGMGSAYSLAHQFWYTSRMAFSHITPIPRHGSQPVDDLAYITADDALVALTFQPYRTETMDGVRLARNCGATVIGVTDSATSPLVPISDEFLACPTSTPQFFESHAVVTGLLETVLAVMVARAGERAQRHIRAFHQRRLEAGIYEETPKLGVGD